MPTFVKDACPVCGCGSHRFLGMVRDDDAPVPVPEDTEIVACANCRLIYVNPMPYWDADDFAKLYDQKYFVDEHTEQRTRWLDIREHKNPRMRFELIKKHLKSDKRKLLEIGAGEFAYMCRYLSGQGWDVTAQEPSPAFQEKLRELGTINVESSGVPELTGEGEYSLIYADSVLEHVPDPLAYFQKLATLLAPGGVLYTVSPNERSAYNFHMNIVSKLTDGAPHYISPYTQPYHLLGYTKKAYQLLAEQSGLRFIWYKKLNDYKAFNMRVSRRNPLLKYPAAAVFALWQGLGLGTNGEVLFVKS